MKGKICGSCFHSGIPTPIVACVSYQSFKILACAAGVNTKEQMKSWASPFAKLWVWKPNTVMAANTTVLPQKKNLFSSHVCMRPVQWDYTSLAVTVGR